MEALGVLRHWLQAMDVSESDCCGGEPILTIPQPVNQAKLNSLLPNSKESTSLRS